jgi:hypothetical protein
MKKYHLIAIASMMGFVSCSEETDPVALGTGEVQMAVGVKLATSSNPNSRVLSQGVKINSGYIQVKELELEVEGEDENGRFEREIEYSFPEIKKINFDQFSSDADFFINIEPGTYEEIEFEVDLIDHRNEPSIYLEGTFEKNDGSAVPLRLEVFGDDDDDLDFELELEGDDDELFFFDGSNNPFALMEIDADGWFSAVSEEDLEDAELTDGVLVISPQKNSRIYARILDRIEDSLDIELELD